MEEQGSEKVEDRVWALHCNGLAPSEISKRVGISEQLTHDLIVYRWKMDKLAYLNRRTKE